MVEKLGIWPGGSPDFLSRASSSVHEHDASAGRKRWAKADAAQNQFFNHDGYTSDEKTNLAPASVSVVQSVYEAMGPAANPSDPPASLQEKINRYWPDPTGNPARPLMSEILGFLPDRDLYAFAQSHGNALDPRILPALAADTMRGNQTATARDLKLHRALNPSAFSSPKILHLDLSFSDVTDTELLQYRERFPNIETLDISTCSKLTNEALKIVPLWPKLRALNIDNNDFDASGLEHLTLCHKLENLSAFACYKINNAALQSIAAIARLHFLKLAHCVNIGDEGIAHFAGSCQLQSIDLRCCAISDQALHFLSLCPDLRSVCVWQSLTDKGVRCLSGHKTLEAISFTNCQNITSQAIAHLRRCPRLQYVNLNGSFLDAQGIKILETMQNLKQLDLNCCANIAPENIRRLVQSCKKLKCLKLTDDQNENNRLLSELKVSHPKVRIAVDSEKSPEDAPYLWMEYRAL